MTEPMRNGVPDTAEWSEFRRDAAALRKQLERSLRRQLVHDARAARARLQNVAAPDLADEAMAWVLAEWRSKPAGTPPAQWMRKRGLQLLDEALDREALAAESRDEERREEKRLLAISLLSDDEERARWLELVDEAGDPPVPFDGLTAEDEVSRVDARLDETELLQQLDRALARLPEVRRRVVVHRYLDDLAPDDVAYLLDMSAPDVETELASAVRALRLDLAPRA
jgi:DNA-directed RNA polymerase specialized sigma24 family protein